MMEMAVILYLLGCSLSVAYGYEANDSKWPKKWYDWWQVAFVGLFWPALAVVGSCLAIYGFAEKAYMRLSGRWL